MNFQFSISTLLSTTTFIAITLGVWVAVASENSGPAYPLEFLAEGPYCIPFAFGGYAIGRRRVSPTLLVVFAIIEAIAAVVGVWAWRRL